MSDLTFVKYCPLCRAENPRQQAFCVKCMDGDLSTVPVEPRRQQGQQGTLATSSTASTTPHCVLELIDNPTLRFTVLPGQTVGRTEKADIILCGVPQFDCISGVHAKFTRRGEQWYVQHLGETNFIKIDGETFRGKEDVAIFPGSVLVLSLTAFRVIIEGT